MTCSWVVVVSRANYFVAFANRAEGTVLPGQAYTFLCLFNVLSHFHCVSMVLPSHPALTVDVVNLLLPSLDLLDLCLCDIHLQWAKGQKYNIKSNILVY